MIDEKQAWSYRGKLLLFLLSAIAVFAATYVLSEGLRTLRTLTVVEAERDQWQRPAAVLQALDLREGNVVADLGSGAGYFSLKLSPMVGRRGQVLAIDIRKLSLAFLWIRAASRSPHNIRVMVGEQDNPRLPAGTVDAVLIANTYHEFRYPQRMLDHAFQSLRPGGRLVIVDRGPPASSSGVTPDTAPGHDIPLSVVETQVRKTGFEIVHREDPFINRPGDDPWWLLTARKP